MFTLARKSTINQQALPYDSTPKYASECKNESCIMLIAKAMESGSILRGFATK